MTHFARQERVALADTITATGPDAPTLCGDWTTRDLAAHIVLRERSIASAGIAIKPLAGWTERAQRRYAAQEYAKLVEDLRHPPAWSLVSNPLLDERLNLLEMYVHHEDVLRAQPGWTTRPMADDFAAVLWDRVRSSVRLAMRRYRASVTIEWPGHEPVTAGAGGEAVTLRGEPGELAMFVTGRQAVADVTVDGPAEAADRLRRARLGI